jgi:hypothetical protein
VFQRPKRNNLTLLIILSIGAIFGCDLLIYTNILTVEGMT